MTSSAINQIASVADGPEASLIPTALFAHTRIVVNSFGIFQTIWPLIAAYWTDEGFFDLWALCIATNGRRITRESFKTFPWTVIMCSVYPVVFVVSLMSFNVFNVWNWLPSRSSPVLLLQLISSSWAVYAMACIWRCHLAQKNSAQLDMTNSSTF